MNETIMGEFPLYPRPKLFILAGMPGCGKSTWARTFFKPWQIVSSDAIREELWPGQSYDPDRNHEVFQEFHRRLDQLLFKRDFTAVADATSLSSAARAELQLVAAQRDAEKHLVFFDNPAQAIRRNADRTGNARVPDEAMEQMTTKFLRAGEDILLELYDTVTIIKGTQ